MPDIRRTFLIFRRELRDALRDRRTVFLMLVLPVLLYPALMLGMLQLAGISKEENRRKTFGVLVAGMPRAPLDAVYKARKVVVDRENARRLEEAKAKGLPPSSVALLDDPVTRLRFDLIPEADVAAAADRLEQTGDFEHRPLPETAATPPASADPFNVQAVVVVPPAFRDFIVDGKVPPPEPPPADAPAGTDPTPFRLQVKTIFNGRNADALAAVRLVHELIDRLRADEFEKRVTALDPQGRLRVLSQDIVFDDENRQPNTGMLSRQFTGTLALLLVVMALTGAFYPAVDLVAGEKERGTIETLLISPATRLETVLGKFAVVCSFSVLTALLNLASMGLTFWYILQLAAQGKNLPPELRPENFRIEPAALAWLLVMLVPLAGMFSGLTLALSTFARSAREGQYYLSPLFLLALPLALPAAIPESGLTAFKAQIPVTGIALALKDMLLAGHPADFKWGQIALALASTIVYASLALRWAVVLFQREGVLFREAEEFKLGMWLRRKLTEPRTLPRLGDAALLFGICLSGQWFVGTMLTLAIRDPAMAALAQQLGVVLVPTLVMAAVLKIGSGLQLGAVFPLNGRHWKLLPLMPLAGLASLILVGAFVTWAKREGLLPDNPEAEAALAKLLAGTPVLLAVLIFAVTPAVGEELLCRGFILAGYRNPSTGGTVVRGIIASSILFGLLHLLGTPLQVIYAAVMGLLLGWITVRTGSLLHAMLVHVSFNGLSVLGLKFQDWLSTDDAAWAATLMDPTNTATVAGAAAFLVGLVVLVWWTTRDGDAGTRTAVA